MKDNDRLIINNFNADPFTLCNVADADKEIERAREYYQRDVEIYEHNLVYYPSMTDHWNEMLEKTRSILKAGFEAVTFEEYKKRQRERWLSKEAKEITEEQYYYALDVLPPKHYVRNERYHMFFIGECTTMSFFGQYLYDKQTGKYWTALTDILDESTWIDKLLGL